MVLASAAATPPMHEVTLVTSSTGRSLLPLPPVSPPTVDASRCLAWSSATMPAFWIRSSPLPSLLERSSEDQTETQQRGDSSLVVKLAQRHQNLILIHATRFGEACITETEKASTVCRVLPGYGDAWIQMLCWSHVYLAACSVIRSIILLFIRSWFVKKGRKPTREIDLCLLFFPPGISRF